MWQEKKNVKWRLKSVEKASNEFRIGKLKIAVKKTGLGNKPCYYIL